MYGMVNKAIEDLVVSNFGEEKWQVIKAGAGVEEDVFLSHESYPDKMTYDLVGSASEVLGVPANDVLVLFGEHWVLKTAREGYGSMLEANGKTLPEFLVNLPSFHTRVAMIFPNLCPPRFNCTEVSDKSLLLHYHSHREGLTYFVVGLLQGLGKMFDTPAQVEVSERKAEGAAHDVFLVSWDNTDS